MGWASRGKKAGPRKIDPATFVPVVWTAEESINRFVVCARRAMRGNPVVGGPKEAVATAEWFSHGIAIQIEPELQILSGFTVDQLNWVRSAPEEHGISKRCAQVALAEAWHGVKVTLDLATMAVHTASNMAKWSRHKRGVRLRNVTAAIHWDRWGKDGVSLEDRAAILSQSGLTCTAAQLEKFAEDRGL